MPGLLSRTYSTPRHTIASIFFLVIALLGAAFLRLYRLDLIDFRFDQAFALHYANDITHGLFWAVQPHGSVAAHPPVYLYLMSLPYLFTSDFLSVVTFRILLSVASVAMCWWIGTRYFNWRVGCVAALLYAVGPWAIQSARNMAVEVQPLFTALMIIGLLELVLRRNKWGWTISGLGLALSIGTHLAGLYLLPVAITGWLLGRKSFRWKPVILGVLPNLALAADYILYDAAHQFVSLHALLAWSGKPSVFTSDALQFALWLSGGSNLSVLTGKAYSTWTSQVPAVLAQLDTLQIVVLAFGVFIAIIRSLALLMHRKPGDVVDSGKRTQAIGILLVLIWWCMPVLLQLRHSKSIEVHYLLSTLPAPFLLMATGADFIYEWVQKIRETRGMLLRRAGVLVLIAEFGILGAIGIWQIATTFHFTSFVARYDTSNGYGLPVRSALRAVQQAKAATTGGANGDVVAVINDYMTPWNEQGMILQVLMEDTPHRFLNSNVAGWIFRPNETSYIFAPGTEKSLNELLAYVSPSQVITRMVPIRNTLSTGYIYAQVKQIPPLTSFTPVEPATWDNGIQLMSDRISLISGTVSGTVRVEMLLHVLRSQPEGVDYHWYNHVFVGDQKLAQQDDSGIHPSSWRVGDYLLQRFDIPISKPLPSEGVYVRIGCYQYPKVEGVMVSQAGKAPENGVNLSIPSTTLTLAPAK